MKIKLAIIRDDDLNFFTTPNDIKDAYGDLFGKVPINFFFVPYLRDINATYEKSELDYFWQKMNFTGTVSIFDNEPLVSFVKEQIELQNIDVGLHGLHHVKHELKAPLDEDKLAMALASAKSLFGRDIKSISAPNNTMSKPSEATLEKFFKFIHISYSHKLWERKLSFSNMKWFLISTLSKLSGRGQHTLFAPGKPINRHTEISSIPISSVQDANYVDNLLDHFIAADSGYICLATHYYDMRDNQYTFDLMKKSVDRLLGAGVKFVRLSDLEQGIK